jgi:shikimate kinase
MAAGKTQLAKDLAQKLNLPYLDSDAELERQEGMTISTIFETKNESYFRALEKQWIDNLDDKPTVISCGGGLPCYNDVILKLKTRGKVVFLDTPIDTIFQRLRNNCDRPLIKNKSKEEIMALNQARGIYYKMADERMIIEKNEFNKLYFS